MNDLRTREGRRREILEQINERKYLSYFWITENRLRASVTWEMELNGEIVLTVKQYPMYDAKITKKGKAK